MKVVILCGGKGERLQEETEFKPKPLIEIGGMPILWHIMKIYSYYGFNEFILPLGYKGSMIKEYFLNFEYMTNDFTLNLRSKQSKIAFHQNVELENWVVTFVDTGLETSTGGRISRIRKYVGNDDFLLTYGDGLADINLKALLKFHHQKDKILTITGISATSQFGIMAVENGLAKSFMEKPRLDGLISGGFFICRSEIFDYLSDDISCVFEQKPMHNLAKDNQVAVYNHQGFWDSMDTYKQVKHLNNLWAQPQPPWKIWN